MYFGLGCAENTVRKNGQTQKVTVLEKKQRTNERYETPLTIMETQPQTVKSAPLKPAEPIIAPLDQLVDGPTLLKIVFPESSRPHMGWLREQVSLRQIPYYRRGRKTYFIPRLVLEWFQMKQTLPIAMLKMKAP